MKINLSSSIYVIIAACVLSYVLNDFTNAQNKAQKNKYQIKSAVVEMNTESSMLGGVTKTTLSFDDYGTKECTESLMDIKMMGQAIKVHQLTICKDKYIYAIDLEKKTGTKTKMQTDYNPDQYDFSRYDEKLLKEWNVKKIGTEKILGKECEKFSFSNAKTNIKGEVAVWKGIALRLETTVGGIILKSTVTNIKEDVKIPSDRFSVPADVKITGVN